MRHPALALASAFGLATSFAACTPDPLPPADAALPDARVYSASELYGPCELDAQCPGEGAICRRALDGYPLGYCTVPCTDRTPCGGLGSANQQCVQVAGEDTSYCQVNCLNSRDCRDGYACIADVNPAGGFCTPLCTSDPQCGGGAICDEYAGDCVAPGSESTAGTVGQPCAAEEDCRGWCISEADFNWPEGSCVSNCILPSGWNTNTFYEGTVLPSGSCPDADICYPNGSFAEGDMGLCIDACTSSDECRDGYTCRQSFQLQEGGMTFTFENGVCWPAA